MISCSIRPRSDTSVAICVGIFVSVVWIVFTWRYGFDLSDEGYYWYGTQRILRGELPMRDFMGYDIGRYAWTAAVMRLLNDDGIVAARVGAALYQICTVVVGVMLALRTTAETLSIYRKFIFAAVVTATLNLWVHPYYKVFDYGTSILLVAMLVMMLTSQRKIEWFGAGLILGVAAIMGRNHGIYGAVSAFMLFCYLSVKHGNAASLIRLIFVFVAGTIVGFSPTFFMGAMIPGFAAGFIASIVELVNSGSTNIALPVPWPWMVDRVKSGWLLWVMGIGSGVGFIAIILLPLIAIFILMRRRLSVLAPAHMLMICSSFVGIAYAHYAYSRADLTHLALAIAPILLLVLSFSVRLKYSLLMPSAVLGLSVLTLAPEKAYLAEVMLNKKLATISIDNTDLYVFPGVDVRLREIGNVFSALPHSSDNFLAVPDAPGLYAIHKKKMPIWETYSLWPRDAAFQQEELVRLRMATPKVVFLSDHALDNRAELRYSKTHPVLYQWIIENYEALPEPSPPRSLKIFVKVP